MNSRFRHELPPALAATVDAIDAPSPASATQLAQQRLLARMRGARSRSRALPMRWWATASAAVLAVVMVAIPLLMDQGRAFAAVQAHFRDFSTLSVRVEQRIDGRLLQVSRMVVDDRGVLRTDVGDELSVIVNPVRGRVLMLQHGPRSALSLPLERSGAGPGAALEWLEQIRDFKGRARPLENARTIDGRAAHGWALEVGGGPLVLWADRNGLPLAMQSGGPGGLEIHYRFEFDVAVPPGHLSSDLPKGYRLVESDER
jgi:hypothetical protein